MSLTGAGIRDKVVTPLRALSPRAGSAMLMSLSTEGELPIRREMYFPRVN